MSQSKLASNAMEYAKGYPCLYGLKGGMASEKGSIWTPVIKNGSTWHVANRKSAAITYFPNTPVYSYILVLSKDSFSTKNDLYILDEEFVHFLKSKGLGKYYIDGQSGKEWYYDSLDYLALRLEFVQSKGLYVIEVLKEDPYPIRDLETEDLLEIIYEDKTIKHKKEIKNTETLYEKFCKLFLKNKVPRRIQSELWSTFSSITQGDENIQYKGIVQWPTGCGKTIAILMKIVLAKEFCDRHGKIYRGLFVSPKNDILDTISGDFNKLSEFGITVYDGSNAKLSKLFIPINSHCLVMACHSALLNENGMRSLPPLTHIHYDETHRITGEEYFKLLKEMILKWNTNFLTGTSATPKTASPQQHKKLAELFGDPLTILHKCDVDEAVQEGWIAKPRFQVVILEQHEDRATVIETFVDTCIDTINKKNKGGKNIFYIESSMDDVKWALNYARRKYHTMNFYAAIDDERSDDKFIKASINNIPHILFACQRYREGSDIPGLEITGKLMGDTTAAHTLIQISGRALRIDYPDKEGWCLIARPSEPGTTIDDVLESILLEILDYLGKSNKNLEPKEISSLVKRYFGELDIEGSECTIQETIQRIQSAYARMEFSKRSPKERYSLIQEYNRELGLTSRNEYHEKRQNHPRFIEDPPSYFKDCWISWYHFLGVDTSKFPQTKAEFHQICLQKGIISWKLYKENRGTDLPENPGELYLNWTNPVSEFGIQEEEVW